MMRALLVLGLGTLLAASPALAQQGRLFQQRPAAPECARGDRHCGKADKPAAKAPAANAPGAVAGVGAAQYGVSPVAPVNPLRVERGGAAGGPERRPEVKAFNTEMKPLGGPGYLPGALRR